MKANRKLIYGEGEEMSRESIFGVKKIRVTKKELHSGGSVNAFYAQTIFIEFETFEGQKVYKEIKCFLKKDEAKASPSEVKA